MNYLLSAVIAVLVLALARARSRSRTTAESIAGVSAGAIPGRGHLDAEDEHAALEELTRTLDSLTDAVVGCSSDWRIQWLNSSARAGISKLGIDPDACLGRVVWEAIPGARGSAGERAALGVMRDRIPAELEERSASGRINHLRIFPTSDGGVAFYARDVTDRKDAELAHQRSENRYRALIEASSDMVWSTDGSGMVEDMPGWRELTGQTVEEVRGQGWLDAVHPDDRARSAEIWWGAYRNRARYENEYRLRRRDGSYRWVRARAVPVANDQGDIVEWVGTLDDIHDARTAGERRELLQRASDTLGATLEIGPTLSTLTHLCVPGLADYASVDLITEHGEIRRVETAHVDPAKERIVRELWTRFPYRATDRVGVPEVIRSGKPALVPEFPDEAVVGFVRDPEQLAMMRALAPASYLCLPLVARGRSLGALSLVFSDSHRRYGESELELAQELVRRAAVAVDNAQLFQQERAAARRAELLSEASRILTSSLDYASTITSVTRLAVPAVADWCTVDLLMPDGSIALLALAHVDPEKEAWGRNLRAGEPTDPESSSGVARVIRSGASELVPLITDEMLLASARDEQHLVFLRGFQLRSYLCAPLVTQGRTLGAISFITTADSDRHYGEADRLLGEEIARRAATAIEHARLFREAEAANRAKTEFLATMSHELRTPLNAIAGYTELLGLGIHGPVTEQQQDALVRIQRSQRHLLSLVNDVLNFARIDSGAVQYAMRDVPLDDALQSVESFVAPQLQGKHLNYEYCAPPPEAVVRADREKLQQIILNLLSNAVKFTDARGTITVTCELRDADALVHVSDTGRGIPDDKLEAIFEPFVQIDRGLTRTSEGTGLGLAISRDLARGMGGELTVTSTLGQGSTFSLQLRRATARVPESAVSAPRRGSPHQGIGSVGE